MKLSTEQRDVTTVGALRTAKATIAANRKTFSFFSDKTYSQVKVACVRELAANAHDSHTMAGKGSVPIEVWLPTELDPVFRVRDQGLGMSPEFMMGPFMAFGDGSTKDGSNEAIGGFGIGSKAPFGYVDQFTIRSVYEGVVSVYSVYKDEEGVPEIAMLDQQDTDEPNGVEVSFPVQRGDETDFEEAAFKTLNYFEPLPLIKNARQGSFKPPQYMSRGKTWGMRETAGPLNIIMGGILYPCPTYNLPYELRYDDRLGALVEYGLDLRLPIGSCDIALSREGLLHSDQTNQAIRQALEDVVDEIVESFSTMFDEYTTLWEAKDALGREIGIGNNRYGYSNRGKFLGENAVYRGEHLEPYVTASNTQVWEIESRSSRRAIGSLKNAKWETYEKHPLRIAPTTTELVIIDDLNDRTSTRRVRYYVEQHCDRARSSYVFRAEEPDNLIKELGNPDVVYVSEMEEPPKVARTKTVRPNVRLFTYDGREYMRNSYDRVVNLSPGPGGYAGAQKGVVEVDYAAQPSTGILVEMNNFDLPNDLREKVASGLITWGELHFANASDVKKLKKTWRMFDDVFEERLRTALSAHPDLPQRIALKHDNHLSQFFNFIGSSGIHEQISDNKKKTTPFGRIASLYETYVEPITPEELRLSRFVTPQLPSRIKPESLAERVDENLRDMIQLVGRGSNYNHLVMEFI